MALSRLLIASAAAMALSGCASIFSGAQQKVSFSSMPSDARITVTDRAGNVVYSGVTPYEGRLKRGAGFMKPQSYTIRFEKDGFAPKQVQLSAGPNGWVFGNLLIGGLVGVLIDGGTGAMFAVSPNELSVPLEAQTLTVSVLDVSQLTPDARARMIPIG